MLMMSKMFAVVGGNLPVSKISYVASGVATNNNTITIPPHQVDDLIIISGYNRGSDVMSVGAGFTQISSFGSGVVRGIVGYRRATVTNTAAGTWTNAFQLEVSIFRGQHLTSPVGNFSINTADNSATMTHSGISLAEPNGTSWLCASSYWNDDNAISPPSGMVTRQSSSPGSNDRIAGHDSNGPIVGFAGSSQPTPGSTYWGTCVVEIKSAP